MIWVRGQRRQPAEMRVEHLHCAIMYSKWLHKCFFLSLKKKKCFQKKVFIVEASLKVSLCYPFRGDHVKSLTTGLQQLWPGRRQIFKKITMMMLPLGFCHFKDRCYIKTARNYVQHQKKGFEDDSSTLRSVCWICCFFLVIFLFFLFCFLHVPPPHYWCWLAVSRSNNMAEWFSKNTVVAVRLFRGVTLEEADSQRRRHRWIQLAALTPARWPTLPGVEGFPLCEGHRGNGHTHTHKLRGWAATQWGFSISFFILLHIPNI